DTRGPHADGEARDLAPQLRRPTRVERPGEAGARVGEMLLHLLPRLLGPAAVRPHHRSGTQPSSTSRFPTRGASRRPRLLSGRSWSVGASDCHALFACRMSISRRCISAPFRAIITRLALGEGALIPRRHPAPLPPPPPFPAPN